VTAGERAAERIFDARAEDYGDDAEGPASRLRTRLVIERSGTGDRVLDVGCANGLHLTAVAPFVSEAVGVDLSARMLERARAVRPENVRLVRASASRLPFASAAFDVAWSFSTLVMVPDAPAAITEIARILRPGGIAILDVPGRLNLSSAYWTRWYRRNGHPGLWTVRHAALGAVLASAGLEIEEQHATGLLDQWRYVPWLRKVSSLDRAVHGRRELDYSFSNRRGLRAFANRWFVVARKGRAT
jgi:SAM-dependent methyltransferase